MRWSSSAGGRRGAIVAAVVMAAATALAGCGSSSSGSAGGATDDSADFKIAYPVAQSLDPHQAAEPAQILIATWPVYDRLIQVSVDAGYKPMLATKWTFSDGGKKLTLNLRKGVTFSDGTPFDAAAVKANLDDYRQAKGTMLAANVADITRVAVVDEHTVELELAKPSTTVLAGLSSELGGVMISPKALGSKDLSSHPVGTGAYVIDSFKPGQEVTYKRRTDKGGIWDEKTGKSATVTVTTMDTDAQTNAVKSGQVDLTVWSQNTAPFSSQLESGQLDHTVMSGVLNMVGVNFNKTMKPFDDPKVRQAVNYAIDRKSIVKAFMPDAKERVQPWPDGLPGFEQGREDSYGYDPGKAKQLLKDAGYADGIDAGEMLVAQTGALPQAAQTVQSNLADVGIKVKLRNMDTYALVSAWAKAKANAEVMYMSLPSIDASAWLDRLYVNPVWTPGGGGPAISKLVTGTDDPNISDAARSQKVGNVIKVASDQAYYAPIWQGVGGFVSSPKVKNLDDLASVNGGVADFRDVYLTK